jgi:hypothetical protein
LQIVEAPTVAAMQLIVSGSLIGFISLPLSSKKYPSSGIEHFLLA